MSNNLRFYVCEECKTVFGLIKDGGGQITCCGKPVKLLEANTTDASQEKHVPVVEKKDGKLVISVGSAPHPMEEKHYIEWIAILADGQTQRFVLNPGAEPVVTACGVEKGTVYAYCNLHGLWKADF